MEHLKERVQSIIDNTLPGFYSTVKERKNCLGGGSYLQIGIATSDYHINKVRGQLTDLVSLRLDDDLTLEPQIYGGCGGQCFYIKPEEGSHYAMRRVKVPFRKPKPREDLVLKALERFLLKYKALLVENRDRLLCSEYADYDLLLGKGK